jgi:hypothetical protein
VARERQSDVLRKSPRQFSIQLDVPFQEKRTERLGMDKIEFKAEFAAEYDDVFAVYSIIIDPSQLATLLKAPIGDSRRQVPDASCFAEPRKREGQTGPV